MTLYQAGLEPRSADERPDGAWWKTPYGRCRMVGEVNAMRERFPGFSLRLSDDGLMTWAGVLRSSLNKRKRYVVRVTYPSRFPSQPPVVTIEKPALDSNRHLLSGARPCLYRPDDGTRGGYDDMQTTAATLVAWTALWTHAYETWKVTGVWPGKEA